MSWMRSRPKPAQLILSIIVGLSALSACRVQSQDVPAKSEREIRTPSPTHLAAASPAIVPGSPATSPTPAPAPLTLAERIARLQKTIESDREHLAALQAKADDLDAEFAESGDEFREIEERWLNDRLALEAAERVGEPAVVQQLTMSLAELEVTRKLAQERFELAIQARQTFQQQVAQLQTKLQSDQQALNRLLNPEEPRPAEPGVTATSPTSAPVAPTSEVASPPSVTAAMLPQSPLPAALPPPDTATADSPPPENEPGVESATDKSLSGPEAMKAPSDKEVLAAQQQAAEAQAAAATAQQEVDVVSQRLAMLDKNIALEVQAREAARKRGDNTEQSLEALENELQRALEQHAEYAALQEIRTRIHSAQQRLREARAEVRRRAEQLDKLHAERTGLLSEQLAAVRAAELKLNEANDAKKKLEAIQNPFAVRNILRWLAQRGPKLLLILLAALGSHLLVHLVARRIVVLLTRGSTEDLRDDRENRANTLVGVFQSTCVVALYVGAVLMSLDVAGIPIAPLLGGAAVVGLAVAFAAQNLIKDYFYGFMILLEDQYGVNDVVSVGGVTGFVERITLRITVVRDFEAVHFIPHGQITTVSNLTHKWSRAVFDIGVSYNEDPDRVIEVLTQLAKELRRDPKFSALILEDPEMLGVDAFGDSAVMIKFFIKTRPLKQWVVKRELLRRIKKRFDELGIEIPFPHRTVYHRYEEGVQLSRRDHEAA